MRWFSRLKSFIVMTVFLCFFSVDSLRAGSYDFAFAMSRVGLNFFTSTWFDLIML